VGIGWKADTASNHSRLLRSASWGAKVRDSDGRLDDVTAGLVVLDDTTAGDQ
jgi:hypothetical protein